MNTAPMNAMRYALLPTLTLGSLLTGCLLASGMALAADKAMAAAPNSTLVNMTADQQTFDSLQNKSFLKGHVLVTYKNVKIRGSEATIDNTPSGEPRLANFYKRPKAHRTTAQGKVDDLEADVIRVFLKEDAMLAEGNAVSYVTSVANDPFTIRSDVQQFDNASKAMVATGHVQVFHEKTKAFSPRALLQIGPNGKAERAIFTGGARIEKENSEINGEKITVMVGSGNLIAERNVHTDVHMKGENGGASKVNIRSDYQQYDKASDTFLASGNVRILYDNYIANGPKATFKLNNGQIDRIIITGRGTIVEGSRKILADQITINTSPKHFDAFGNVKSQFESQKAQPTAAPAPSTAAKPAKKGTAKPSKPKGEPATSGPKLLPLLPEELEN